MNGRRHGSKPTLALWMLIAVVDVALLAASAGLFTVLLVVAALVTASAFRTATTSSPISLGCSAGTPLPIPGRCGGDRRTTGW
jgi:hypothetical protein